MKKQLNIWVEKHPNFTLEELDLEYERINQIQNNIILSTVLKMTPNEFEKKTDLSKLDVNTMTKEEINNKAVHALYLVNRANTQHLKAIKRQEKRINKGRSATEFKEGILFIYFR